MITKTKHNKKRGGIFLNYEEKEIDNFPGYTICENGEVFSYRNTKKKVSLKGFVSKNNYHYVDLCNMTTGIQIRKRFAVRRLVGFYFLDGYFDGAVINHKDGNTLNNCKENLEWVTQTQNIHCSYLNSGIGPKRNYCKYQLVREGEVLPILFKGFPDLEKHYKEVYPSLPFKQLQKYGKAHEFSLLKFPK